MQEIYLSYKKVQNTIETLIEKLTLKKNTT